LGVVEGYLFELACCEVLWENSFLTQAFEVVFAYYPDFAAKCDYKMLCAGLLCHAVGFVF
jgi:hypothetical protein